MGELLIWQASEDNLYYAQTSEIPTPTPTSPTDLPAYNFRTLDFDFEWDCGFRIGAGYNIPYDRWDIGLNWTHMRNHSRDHMSGDSDTAIQQVWGSATPEGTLGVATTKARGSWKVNLEQVDLQLGREFYVGRHLTLRPNVGARSAFISKNLHQLSQERVV